MFCMREKSTVTNSFRYFCPKLKHSLGKHLYVADMKGTLKYSVMDQRMEKMKNMFFIENLQHSDPGWIKLDV